MPPKKDWMVEEVKTHHQQHRRAETAVVGGVKRKVYAVKGPAEGGSILCLSLPEEELSAMNSKEDGTLRTWICDRCLTLSSTIQELLCTVKVLSERIQ